MGGFFKAERRSGCEMGRGGESKRDVCRIRDLGAENDDERLVLLEILRALGTVASEKRKLQRDRLRDWKEIDEEEGVRESTGRMRLEG